MQQPCLWTECILENSVLMSVRTLYYYTEAFQGMSVFLLLRFYVSE